MESNNLIERLVLNAAGHATAREFVERSPVFNDLILSYREPALRIWASLHDRFRAKEALFAIPYRISESPKLYAIDALAVSAPFVDDDRNLQLLAELFTAFYLSVHYFDDHVENRSKFFSKFEFAEEVDLDLQRGAAPFSFTLIAIEVIYDILDELRGVSDRARLEIADCLIGSLAAQTRYFASERRTDLTPQDVLEIKQHQVSGQTLAVIADILARMPGVPAEDTRTLKQGLVYLGSLTQITDDIRDMALDAQIGNANVVNSYLACHGQADGPRRLAAMYQNESDLAVRSLSAYTTGQLSVVMSLPFYPFVIDKAALRTPGTPA